MERKVQILTLKASLKQQNRIRKGFQEAHLCFALICLLHCWTKFNTATLLKRMYFFPIMDLIWKQEPGP